MKTDEYFSLRRWWTMARKEFLQLRRDRVTFVMIVAIPVVQLVVFGFAINNDPKHMPTGLIVQDHSELTRDFVSALRSSEYFAILDREMDEESAAAAIAIGRAQFVVTIPAGFSRDLLRGERPALLIQADASDPVASSAALAAASQLPWLALNRDLKGALANLAPGQPPFEVRLQRLYNPEGITRYNIVPGLMGVILTVIMVMMTGLAITRERERGTMENLLAMPLLPLEVMAGKIIPYLAIGLFQVTLILAGARFMFQIPMFGSLSSLYFSALLFIAANLAVGVTLSSLAANQLQAMQLTTFYFLPNIMLSGFMFPFQGMPAWARAIGNLMPLTHFNRLVRGIMLKGNDWHLLWPSLWPLALFTAIVMLVAVKFYRRTLD